MKKYLLKTSGRSGSHLILMHLHQMKVHSDHTGPDPQHTVNTIHLLNTENLDTVHDKGIVIHDHQYDLPHDPHRWHLIVSQRRNKLKQSLSMCLAEITNNYGTQPVDPNMRVAINPTWVWQELERHIAHDRYYEILSRRVEWEAVTTVYMEDFFNDSKHLCTLFGGDPVVDWSDPMHKLTLRGHSIETVVVNYAELAAELDSAVDRVTPNARLRAERWYLQYAHHARKPAPDAIV